MKVAIMISGCEVSRHFGRAEELILVEVDNGEIVTREALDASTYGCGTLPVFLGGSGVEYLITGGIGADAMERLAAAGIKVYSGIEGSAEDALGRLLAGTLTSTGNVCAGAEGTCGHNREHDCGH